MTAENSKRIAKNTGLLYIRMLLIMAVSLYTSRIVLDSLGVEDFGFSTERPCAGCTVKMCPVGHYPASCAV